MKRQRHNQPLFDKKISYEVNDRHRGKQQREYIRQGRVSNLLRLMSSWFGGLFRSAPIPALDLSGKRPRDHGAVYLRSVFPRLKKNNMVSTRDGRPV